MECGCPMPHKLEKWKLCHNLLILYFLKCLIPFVKFSCWSKFHVKTITASRVITVFTRLDWKSGKRKCTYLRFFFNILKLEHVSDIKLCLNVSNVKLLNNDKARVTSHIAFSIIKGPPLRVKFPPIHINGKTDLSQLCYTLQWWLNQLN